MAPLIFALALMSASLSTVGASQEVGCAGKGCAAVDAGTDSGALLQATVKLGKESNLNEALEKTKAQAPVGVCDTFTCGASGVDLCEVPAANGQCRAKAACPLVEIKTWGGKLDASIRVQVNSNANGDLEEMPEECRRLDGQCSLDVCACKLVIKLGTDGWRANMTVNGDFLVDQHGNKANGTELMKNVDREYVIDDSQACQDSAANGNTNGQADQVDEIGQDSANHHNIAAAAQAQGGGTATGYRSAINRQGDGADGDDAD